MRKLVLLLLLLLCLSSPALAVDFVEIVRDEDDLIYLDVDSIAQRSLYGHDYIVAWTKSIPRGDTLKEELKLYKVNSIDYIMRFWALGKDQKQIQLLSLNVYDKKGK